MVEEIQPNPNKLLSMGSTLGSIVAADTELKYLAQKVRLYCVSILILICCLIDCLIV